MPARGLVVALAGVLLLSGCTTPAADTADAPPDPGLTATPGAADAPTAGQTDSTPATGDAVEPPDSAAGDLADLAEQLAGEEPTSGSIQPRSEPVLGADISWPQCPKGMGIPERPTQGMPMPAPEAEYVIVGLTNGPAFTPNPCLADQVDWVAERNLMAAGYSVLSYPDDDQLARYGGSGPYDAENRLGRLRNVGYQQASYNLDNMRRAGLKTPIVWLDVEPVRIWEWSGDKVANAAVVEGAAKGYREAGLEIGVYSTPYMWEQIVGSFAMGVPEWRAAGPTSRAEATSRCGEDWSIQGGPAIMGQWVADRRDHNITCPGVAADLGRWFHPY